VISLTAARTRPERRIAMRLFRTPTRPRWIVEFLDRALMRRRVRKLRRALSRLGPMLIEEFTPAQAGMNKAMSLLDAAMRRDASSGGAAGVEA